MKVASHAWITRHLFPFGGDSQVGTVIIHWSDPTNLTSLAHEMTETLVEFYKEIGVEIGVTRTRAPREMEHGRFEVSGPKGFIILEITSGYTQEEFDLIDKGEEIRLDMSVWGAVFGANLPTEQED